MDKRRRFPRSVPPGWRFFYRIRKGDSAEGEMVQAPIVNVSRGGVCFESESKIESGTQIDLEFQASGFPRPIVGTARVVWCRPSEVNDRFEVGAEFQQIDWQPTSNADSDRSTSE